MRLQLDVGPFRAGSLGLLEFLSEGCCSSPGVRWLGPELAALLHQQLASSVRVWCYRGESMLISLLGVPDYTWRGSDQNWPPSCLWVCPTQVHDIQPHWWLWGWRNLVCVQFLPPIPLSCQCLAWVYWLTSTGECQSSSSQAWCTPVMWYPGLLDRIWTSKPEYHMHNLAPVYLTELCVPRQTHRAGLRSGNRNLLEVPKVKTKYYGERAFAYAGPTVWNRLTASLCGHDLALSAFKRDLKTFLFDLTS